MYVSQVKDLVEKYDGEVTDVGYETFGDYKKAFVEVYYEDSEAVPAIPALEEHDDIVVNLEWDEPHNGVLYEVTISEQGSR